MPKADEKPPVKQLYEEASAANSASSKVMKDKSLSFIYKALSQLSHGSGKMDDDEKISSLE